MAKRSNQRKKGSTQTKPVGSKQPVLVAKQDQPKATTKKVEEPKVEEKVPVVIAEAPPKEEEISKVNLTSTITASITAPNETYGSSAVMSVDAWFNAERRDLDQISARMAGSPMARPANSPAKGSVGTPESTKQWASDQKSLGKNLLEASLGHKKVAVPSKQSCTTAEGAPPPALNLLASTTISNLKIPSPRFRQMARAPPH